MAKGILGRKLGMTQVFEEDGRLIPVTVIEAGPCQVIQKKNVETDGYEAIQVAFTTVTAKRINKPLRGHFAKAKAVPAKILREFRTEGCAQMGAFNVGDEVKVDLFAPGEYVDVTGTSKGKGFTGVIKRWGFNRGPMSHGSMYHRRVGSLGATEPARVFKGRKMSGRAGGVKRTIQKLRVVQVDAEKNLLLVSGSVPGPVGSMVIVRETVKSKV
jgi:large subunit ribosomal protein L3